MGDFFLVDGYQNVLGNKTMQSVLSELGGPTRKQQQQHGMFLSYLPRTRSSSFVNLTKTREMHKLHLIAVSITQFAAAEKWSQ